MFSVRCEKMYKFQLTRLMRGVTPLNIRFDTVETPISTHTPHARRDFEPYTDNIEFNISTHTPHARRDPSTSDLFRQIVEFQLTRLMRGVT